jgi:hypothetical protein
MWFKFTHSNKYGISNVLWAYVPKWILMEKVSVGTLTKFTYPGKRKGFPQPVCCGEKYSQLKLMNIQNNSKNFLVNS